MSRPLYRGCLLSKGPLLEVLLYTVVLRIQIQSHSHFTKQIPSCIDVTWTRRTLPVVKMRLWPLQPNLHSLGLHSFLLFMPLLQIYYHATEILILWLKEPKHVVLDWLERTFPWRLLFLNIEITHSAVTIPYFYLQMPSFPSPPLPFSQVAQLPVANLALLIYLCRFSQCNQFNFSCPLYHPHLYLHWWTCYQCHLEEGWGCDNCQWYPPANQESSWSCCRYLPDSAYHQFISGFQWHCGDIQLHIGECQGTVFTDSGCRR